MHPAEAYVGIPFDPDRFDCADLVVRVQRDLFGREVALANGRRPRGEGAAARLPAAARELARRVDAPRDGDLVLMLDETLRFPGHAGVWFHIAHEDYVLHAHHRIGMAVLHKARDLAGFGAPIEGFYRWH